MLVELGLVEQRYAAVLEVLNGAVSVSEVARRFGGSRQSVHRWLLEHFWDTSAFDAVLAREQEHLAAFSAAVEAVS